MQQENEQLLLNNEDQIDVTNEVDDQPVQLPTNNQSRFFFSWINLKYWTKLYIFV